MLSDKTLEKILKLDLEPLVKAYAIRMLEEIPKYHIYAWVRLDQIGAYIRHPDGSLCRQIPDNGARKIDVDSKKYLPLRPQEIESIYQGINDRLNEVINITEKNRAKKCGLPLTKEDIRDIIDSGILTGLEANGISQAHGKARFYR